MKPYENEPKKKMMEMQKKTMALNMDMMKQSFKVSDADHINSNYYNIWMAKLVLNIRLFCLVKSTLGRILLIDVFFEGGNRRRNRNSSSRRN